MMPVLTVPPADPAGVVSMTQLRNHLRVNEGDDDALIAGFLAAAVQYLDGVQGMLGRAILQQTWVVTVAKGGLFRLPLPDVQAVTADYGSGAVPIDMMPSLVGADVDLSGPALVTMTAAMGAADRALAAVIVQMIVGHWYDNREAVNVGNITSILPLSAEALIARLRWRWVPR